MFTVQPLVPSASSAHTSGRRVRTAVRALVAATALSAVVGAGALALDAPNDSRSDLAGTRFNPDT